MHQMTPSFSLPLSTLRPTRAFPSTSTISQPTNGAMLPTRCGCQSVKTSTKLRPMRSSPVTSRHLPLPALFPSGKRAPSHFMAKQCMASHFQLERAGDQTSTSPGNRLLPCQCLCKPRQSTRRVTRPRPQAPPSPLKRWSTGHPPNHSMVRADCRCALWRGCLRRVPGNALPVALRPGGDTPCERSMDCFRHMFSH